ncbi:MAG: AbrB/MazE/SpoVT family DNA-binding domain-containing protein [Nanoarchaeota archaeon]|nr:AbrB/MazE/SpoVT family DNA-binding domain-containing protein [Nanoarchaeota archaeon]MBU1103716.1 AbrB/MazE/SpoVT family DNA-binding domain-containing protein [Nanoarchaeota archaeon]
MKSLTRTRAIGGSLVVTIPAEIVKGEILRENEVVEIEVSKPRKDFFGALKGIGKFTEEDRMEDRF